MLSDWVDAGNHEADPFGDYDPHRDAFAYRHPGQHHVGWVCHLPYPGTEVSKVHSFKEVPYLDLPVRLTGAPQNGFSGNRILCHSEDSCTTMRTSSRLYSDEMQSQRRVKVCYYRLLKFGHQCCYTCVKLTRRPGSPTLDLRGSTR